MPVNKLWLIIKIVTGILVFSYPAAFSYDFFNYLFTAKTVLVYHHNPYTTTPIQFSGIDPWTNFMRWTHLASAYTPLWIGMSMIPYILGLGYFLTVLFSMKFFIAGFYLFTCWMLYKVTKSSYALAFFALNPLVLIEILVSGHNDIVLAAFAVFSIWFYERKEFLTAWFVLALSIASKLMTIFLIPVYIMKKNRWWMLIAMFVGLAVVLVRREFLPWYWVWILPFIALHSKTIKIVHAAIIISFGLVLSYAPYIYFGDYLAASQLWKTSLIWSGVGLGGLLLIFGI